MSYSPRDAHPRQCLGAHATEKMSALGNKKAYFHANLVHMVQNIE